MSGFYEGCISVQLRKKRLSNERGAIHAKIQRRKVKAI